MFLDFDGRSSRQKHRNGNKRNVRGKLLDGVRGKNRSQRKFMESVQLHPQLRSYVNVASNGSTTATTSGRSGMQQTIIQVKYKSPVAP